MLAIRAIPRDIPCIVSVSDTTYNENHTKPKYVIMCSNNKNILQGASLIIMKASELRPHLGYRLLGCLCMMKSWHQIVQAEAIRATQLVEYVWSMRHCHMSSKTGMFELGTLSNCIGEVKLCVPPKYIWQRLWSTILSLTSLQDLVSLDYLTCNNIQ